ncbi:MAG: hypothetical protein AB8B93_10375 [Pseudomonadales bacterium]
MQSKAPGLLILLASLFIGSGAFAQVQAPHDCVLDAPDALVHLWQTHHAELGYQNIYTHPCTGGVYLIDPRAENDVVHVLWQGWWLQRLYPPVWDDNHSVTDAGTGPTLALTGRFITGAGPTGTEPFTARIFASYSELGWAIHEPQTNVGDQPAPRVSGSGVHQMFEIHSAAELAALGLANEPWRVDFATERLVIKNADLRSNSEAAALVDATTYLLQINGPRIGNTYTVPGLWWMVMPKDDRNFVLGRSDGAEQCLQCRAGKLRHPRVRWSVPTSRDSRPHR